MLNLIKIKEDLRETIYYYLEHNKANVNIIDDNEYRCYEINKYEDNNLDGLEEKAIRALYDKLYQDNLISTFKINKYTLILMIRDRYFISKYKYYLYSNEPISVLTDNDDNIIEESRETLLLI